MNVLLDSLTKLTRSSFFEACLAFVSRNLKWILILGLFAVLVMTICALSGNNSSPRFEDKVIKYRIEVSNPKGDTIKKTSLLVALPAELRRQEISSMIVSEGYKKITDDMGNTSIDIALSDIAPYDTKIINIKLDMKIDSKLSKTRLKKPEIFTRSEKYIESDNEKIIKQASLIEGKTNLELSKKTFDWVVSYLSDAGFIAEDRGALQAFNSKKADCTGYMYLYGALLRAKGIPARMMSGFIVESNKKLKTKDYHNWVEVYLDGVWRVVDPQNKKFLENESSYIAMRVISNAKLDKFDHAQQLLKSDQQLKISMN